MIEAVWHQERPEWCPHTDCIFRRRVMDASCIGQLPQPEPHDGDFNTHRWCITNVLPGDEIFDLQINRADVGWFKLLFEVVDNDGIHRP